MSKILAGKILNFVYNNKFENNKIPSVNEIFIDSSLKPHQLEMALNYCMDKNYLKISKKFGVDKNGIRNMDILGITSEGIDLVEDKEKFQRSFGIGANLGIVNFNWSTQER